MKKFQKTEKYEGVKPEQVFEAGKEAFEDLGMEIVKLRSFAFFLQAQTKEGQELIDANLLVSSFQNEYTLTLTSESIDQDRLESFADKYLVSLKLQL